VNKRLNALKTLSERANRTDNHKFFFPLLHEFAKLVLLEPHFQKALKTIAAKAEEAIKPVRIHKEKALSELKACERKIRGYLSNNNVASPAVVQLLDIFQDRLKTLNRPDGVLLAPLEQAMNILLNDEHTDHSDFMQSFGNIKRINDDKYISRKDAFPMYDTWEKETLCLVQAQQTAAWYSLNQLTVFFERSGLTCST
jgi:hypothetical protein